MESTTSSAFSYHSMSPRRTGEKTTKDLLGPERAAGEFRRRLELSQPSQGCEQIAGWLAFYPERVDCFVDGEQVPPQAGAFYGGWITPEITGPFKGGPGTITW